MKKNAFLVGVHQRSKHVKKCVYPMRMHVLAVAANFNKKFGFSKFGAYARL